MLGLKPIHITFESEFGSLESGTVTDHPGSATANDCTIQEETDDTDDNTVV